MSTLISMYQLFSAAIHRGRATCRMRSRNQLSQRSVACVGLLLACVVEGAVGSVTSITYGTPARTMTSSNPATNVIPQVANVQLGCQLVQQLSHCGHSRNMIAERDSLPGLAHDSIDVLPCIEPHFFATAFRSQTILPLVSQFDPWFHFHEASVC